MLGNISKYIVVTMLYKLLDWQLFFKLRKLFENAVLTIVYSNVFVRCLDY